MLYPLLLQAVCKNYLWGGTRLKTEFYKKSKLEKVAESWELSCHKDGLSKICNGEYTGLSLTKYFHIMKRQVLGSDCQKFDYFPILVKLIDAQQSLSLQVHPNNEYALRVEGEYGKSEIWYIIDAEPGATLFYGFNHKISKKELKERIKKNTLLKVVKKIQVKKGDVIFIEAGTLHAIGKGIVIAEIQQNSNTTYRVYDFCRLGVDGNPRELHIDKAIEVIDLDVPKKTVGAQGKPETKEGYTSTLLASCEYFHVCLLQLKSYASFVASAKSFHSILCLDGKAEIIWKENSETKSFFFQKGDSLFIPAGLSYCMHGTCEYLLTKV